MKYSKPLAPSLKPVGTTIPTSDLPRYLQCWEASRLSKSDFVTQALREYIKPHHVPPNPCSAGRSPRPSTNPGFGANVPRAHYKIYAAHAEKAGVTVSSFVRMALDAYVAAWTSRASKVKPTPVDNLDDLMEDVYEMMFGEPDELARAIERRRETYVHLTKVVDDARRAKQAYMAACAEVDALQAVTTPQPTKETA